MRLPFSPFQAQNVPQLAVAQPQQMPRLGAVPDVTAGVQSAMMGKQLIQLGDQIQRSVQDIGGVILQDREQKRREQQREDNLMLQEASQGFKEGDLYYTTNKYFDEIQLDFRSAGTPVEILGSYKSLAKQNAEAYIQDKKIDPESELAQRIRVEFRGLALQQAQSVASNDRTVLARQNKSKVDTFVADLKNKFLLAVQGRQADLARTEARGLTPEESKALFDQFFGEEALAESLSVIPENLRSALRSDLETFGISIGRSANANWVNQQIQELEKEQRRVTEEYVFSQKQAFIEEYQALKLQKGEALTKDEIDSLFGKYNEAVGTAAGFDALPEKFKPDALNALRQFYSETSQAGIEEFIQTEFRRKKIDQRAADSGTISKTTNAFQTIFDERLSKFAKDSPDQPPKGIVDDFYTDGEINEAKLDEFIAEREITFNDQNNREELKSALRSILTRVKSAETNAEAANALKEYKEGTQQKINEAIRANEDEITRLAAEAQLDSSIAGKNLEEIDKLIAGSVTEGVDDAQTMLIEDALRTYYSSVRKQVIGSDVKENYIGKEVEAQELILDLIDNPETGFKAWANNVGTNPQVLEEYSFAQFNSVFDLKREEVLSSAEAKLDETFGDNENLKRKYLLDLKKNLYGIDLQEDKKFSLQIKQTQKEQFLLTKYTEFESGLQKQQLDLINSSNLPADQKLANFEASVEKLFGKATESMTDIDRLNFISRTSSLVQSIRLSLTKEIQQQEAQQHIADVGEAITRKIEGQDGEVWNDETYAAKRAFITDRIDSLYRAGHIDAEGRVDQLIKSLRELDRNDASLLVASDPEQALELIKQNPGGSKPEDRFHNLTVDDRLRYRSAASKALSAGLTAAKRELDVGLSNHFMKMNFLEEGGSYFNADPSILNTVAQAYGAKSIETQNAVLQFSYLEDIGRNLEGEIENIPTADLQYALEFFSPNNYQPKIGAGEAEKLNPYYNDLRRRLNGEIERRRKDPAASSWERLKAEGKGDVSYFNDGMQAGVLVTQFYMDPAFAQKSARVLPEDFVKQTKTIWDNGVESGSEQWDTVSFNSQQDIIYVRKAMAAQMLKSPLATQELVQAGVTNYAELEAYQKMDPDQLRAMENGKLDTKNTLKNLTASSYDYASRAIEDNGEVQKILNSYPFAERRNLLNLMEQHVAGQEVDDFQARIRATAAVFALGSGYAVANTKNSSEYGTVKLPAEMDAGRVSSLLSGRRFSRELVENIGVVDAYGATVKADFSPVAKEILNNGEWRWRNFTASAGQESTGLTIEILTDANTFTTLTDSSGRPVYLGFKELQDYIDSGDRSMLFTESPIKALQQWRVIGTAERIKLASQVAGPANVEPTGDGFAPIAEGMARMGNAAIGLNAKRNAALKQTAIDLLGMASPENAAALANFEFYDLVKPGSAFHNSIRPKWRDRLQKSVEQQPGE